MTEATWPLSGRVDLLLLYEKFLQYSMHITDHLMGR